jgi:hypothetical protein
VCTFTYAPYVWRSETRESNEIGAAAPPPVVTEIAPDVIVPLVPAGQAGAVPAPHRFTRTVPLALALAVWMCDAVGAPLRPV